MLTRWRSSWIASAPIFATNVSEPYFAFSSRKRSSEMRSFSLRFSASSSGPDSMMT